MDISSKSLQTTSFPILGPAAAKLEDLALAADEQKKRQLDYPMLIFMPGAVQTEGYTYDSQLNSVQAVKAIPWRSLLSRISTRRSNSCI